MTLNAGGIIAGYDTDLEYQPKCGYLHGDSLKKTVEECHKAGIRVIARMDFSKIREDVYEKHPNWAYKRADGEIVNYGEEEFTLGRPHPAIDPSIRKPGLTHVKPCFVPSVPLIKAIISVLST